MGPLLTIGVMAVSIDFDNELGFRPGEIGSGYGASRSRFDDELGNRRCDAVVDQRGKEIALVRALCWSGRLMFVEHPGQYARTPSATAAAPRMDVLDELEVGLRLSDSSVECMRYPALALHGSKIHERPFNG